MEAVRKIIIWFSTISNLFMFCCIASTLQFSFSCVGHPYISSVHYPGISILKTVRVKQKVANVVSLKRSRFLRNSHHIGQLIMTIVCTDPSRVRNSNGKLHIILSVGNFFASHNELRGIRTHGIPHVYQQYLTYFRLHESHTMETSMN